MTPSMIPLTKTKVGTGVLFFCFNNGLVDYTKLTRLATKLVHKNLGLPVCVVTDQAHTDFGSEHVVRVEKPESSTPRYFGDYAKTATWYNVGRECSLDVTPFRHTVVLDSDYLVLSDVLLKYASMPLALSRSAFFLGGHSDRDMSYMPLTNMPMYWATVIVFDSCSWPAEVFFSAMKRLRSNWNHIAAMSGLDPSLYRNDYVATMALSLIQENRWSKEFDLPIRLVTAGFDYTVSDLDLDAKALRLDKTTSTEVLRIKGTDVHVFNKKSLLESLDAAQV